MSDGSSSSTSSMAMEGANAHSIGANLFESIGTPTRSSFNFIESSSVDASSPLSVTVRETRWSGFVNELHEIWSYNLSTVDGADITIGKILAAILLIVLGFYFSRLLSRLIAWAFIRKASIHEGAALAFQSIAFYILVTTFSLVALTLVHIPLTVFTILGGAVAIGFGFGSQNLASNFISGVILLVEQPVRVGDNIEVEGVQGNVLRIGLRSTLVRTPNNLDVVVPNNLLLDRRIINWTLSDSNVRRALNVTLSYGSDVKRVEAISVALVADKVEVLRLPEPAFFVVNFGLKGIECELRFWMSGRSISECLRVESEIRVAMLGEFERAGVTIAVG